MDLFVFIQEEKQRADETAVKLLAAECAGGEAVTKLQTRDDDIRDLKVRVPPQSL